MEPLKSYNFINNSKRRPKNKFWNHRPKLITKLGRLVSERLFLKYIRQLQKKRSLDHQIIIKIFNYIKHQNCDYWF